MLAAPLSAIIKMKRWSNQHNTNGNSITTKETEGDLFLYFPLRWEKALMVQRKTVSEKWGRPHLDRITVHKTGDVSGSQQKLFISVFLCSVWKTRERGQAHFMRTVRLVMLQPLPNIHTQWKYCHCPLPERAQSFSFQTTSLSDTA